MAALVILALAAGLALLAGHVGVALALRPLRALDPSAPWQERARLAYPARVFSGANAVLPASIAAAYALSLAGPLSSVPRGALLAIAALAAAIPGFRMRLQMEREVRRIRLPVGRWIRGGLVLVLLMMPHLLVAFAVNLAMPADFGARAFATLLAGAAFTFYLVRGGVLDVARLFGLARAASPRLAAIVDRTSSKAGVRPRAVFELLLPWANAYAYPLSGRLAFTDEALDALTDDEIAAVCAHELGHLAEPRRIAASRVVGVFAFFLPFAVVKPLLASYGPRAFGYAILGAYASAVVLRVLLLRLFKRMEEKADKVAHEHEGDAGTYARALTRIHEVNLMPVVMPTGRGVHPSLYDRVAAAGAPMTMPRPAPPPRARVFVAIIATLAIVVVGFAGARAALNVAAAPLERTETGIALFAAAARGGSARDLAALGSLRASRGDTGAALAFFRAADDAGPLSSEPTARFAILLAGADQCGEADDEAVFAESLLSSEERAAGESAAVEALIREAQEAVRRCDERAMGKDAARPAEVPSTPRPSPADDPGRGLRPAP